MWKRPPIPYTTPQARSAEYDLNNFVRKARAGADRRLRIFLQCRCLFPFRGRRARARVEIPIVPGITPIAKSSASCTLFRLRGAEIPRWLRLKLQSYADDTAAIKALALDVVTEMCRTRLREGVPQPGISHTLNQAGLVSTICQRLGY